jgi:hypothetical protein
MNFEDLENTLPQPAASTKSSNKNISREAWKVFQIMSEFVEGTEKLSCIEPSVSIFGSARTPKDNPYYELTKTLLMNYQKQASLSYLVAALASWKLPIKALIVDLQKVLA